MIEQSKKTILIVDDLPANIDVANNALQHHFKVKAATSGKAALKVIFSNDPPDLVLLDVVMPEQDGYSICRELRRNKKSQTIPVIFLSATLDDEVRLLTVQAGGNDCISKTALPQELIQVVNRCLV